MHLSKGDREFECIELRRITPPTNVVNVVTDPASPSIHNLQQVPSRVEKPGFRQVVFRGLDQMVGLIAISPDMEDKPLHNHPWEQTNMLVESQVDFVVGDDRISLDSYDIFAIPPDTPHAVCAADNESAVLFVVWPLREDYLFATEYQTEF